ncbi:hypothetical protein F0562_025761 [Nyssa sinensis]|uniref:RING-type domain-containing protein n=1 Tax=Nyssa sinensis TaxID=561372 RepID=A0A5J5B8P7_9ASTE|nr:hypothetical protein F0562_025761 [Nyssa sinensis]
MNSTMESTDAPEYRGWEGFGAFGNIIGLSFGILIFMIIVAYASYVCTRMLVPAQSNQSSHRTSQLDTDHHDSMITIEQGLDEATLLSYQKLLYSQVKLHSGDSRTSACSICLADYKDSDMLRLLPDCGHLFHLKCVDLWLKLHPTCPICRNLPLATPPAEDIIAGLIPTK